MPSVGSDVGVSATGVLPAGWVIAIKVAWTAVSTASTVAWTLVPPPAQARAASAIMPKAHNSWALMLLLLWTGRARLVHTDHFAMIIQHDPEAEHTQIGARLGRQAVVNQPRKMLVHVVE